MYSEDLPGSRQDLPAVSVVVPVHNGDETLELCLSSLKESTVKPLECLVVDDASIDDSAALAERQGAVVLKLETRSGPAAARNLGAIRACGDIVLFLDSDVCVHPDTIQLLLETFAADSALDALMGSYDDSPSDPGFCSQYRNLLHCFVHRTGKRKAATFWTGCGAIRRDVFLSHGGFDERHRFPSVEDIEFGYRITAAGRRIMLDSAVQVTHLKRWPLSGMLYADVASRGIPWTRLMLRYRNVPNDLNLRWSQRASILAVWAAVALATAALVYGRARYAWLATVSLGALVALNAQFYLFLAQKRGWLFASAAVPIHGLHHFLNGLSFLLGIAVYLISDAQGLAAREAPNSQESA